MEEEEEEEGTSHRDCLVRERISPFFTCSRDVSRELQEGGGGGVSGENEHSSYKELECLSFS